MSCEPVNQPSLQPEFVFHVPTNAVGIVIGISAARGETHKTIRLAGGETVSAPAKEFRPATEAEVESRHLAAATVRPFALPVVPKTRVYSHSNRPWTTPLR